MLSLLVVAVDAFDAVDAAGEHRWFITVVSLVAGTGWPPSSRHLVPRSTSHPGYALRPGIYLLFVPFRVYRHPITATYASVSLVDVLSRDRYASSARCPVPDCFHCSVPGGEGLRRLCALESGRTRGILMTMYCGSSLFVGFSLLSFPWSRCDITIAVMAANVSPEEWYYCSAVMGKWWAFSALI